VSAAAEQFERGIRSRVPWGEYLSLAGTSISRLKELRRSPQHYLYRLSNPKESKPMTLGIAAHTAVLEPERFERQFAVWRRRTDSGNLAPRRGQYWDAFEGENAGKTIITEDEHELATAIATAVRGNSNAMRYLQAGEPEVTLQWQLDGRLCRGRVDWFTRVAPPNSAEILPHIVGLKSARDCRLFKFGNQAAVLGYHLQWGYYFDGYKAIKEAEPRMVEIVVESEPPHAVAVYEIPQDILDQGRDEYQALMLRLAECESTGHFPGPQEQEEPLSLPSWVYGEATDDITELGLEVE
jgi:hypothetical protein